MPIPYLLGSILFVGDSHSVGPFGQALDKKLRSVSAHVTTATYCGTIVNDFYRTDAKTQCGYLEIDEKGASHKGTIGPVADFRKLLEKTRPAHVLVALATNYSGYENDTFVINDMKKMVNDIIASGAQCFWIGMPTSRTLKSQHERISKLTKKAVGSQCTYFDSFSVTSYPEIGGDGIHFYFPGGKEVAENWALRAFQAFIK